MDLPTFWDNFEVIAEAPGGVQRLRELILDLAVRGKLVPQDPADEPADRLLQRLILEKEQYETTKRRRTKKKIKEISMEEKPWEIPSNWKWMTLDSVGDWGAGATPLRSQIDYYDGSYNWFKSGELPDGYLRGPSNEMITDLALQECSLRLNQVGDVLIAMYGATIGKLAILEESATTNQAVCACTCYPSIHNRYLFTFLLAWRKRFASMGAGAAQPNISRVKIINTFFPLPPLAEQKRIVAKVDELMALCDRYEVLKCDRNSLRTKMRASAIDALMNAEIDESLNTAWEFIQNNLECISQVPADVEDYRQTILKLAVSGKITYQSKHDQPASTLVERAFAEKKRLIKEKKITKRKPQPEIDISELPFNPPFGWSFVRFGDVVDIASGVTKGRKLGGRTTESYPYLRVANVQRGNLNLAVMKEIEIPVDELEKYQLQPGDVVLTEGGDWDKLGRSAIWQGEIENCIHQNHVFRARILDRTLLPEWTSMYTNSAVGRKYFESAAKRTTNLASINMTQLRFCPFPIPPLAEQKRIVTKVDQLMALCDTLETHLRETQDKATAFAAAVVGQLEV